MTLRVEVTIPEDDVKAGAGAQYLDRAMAAIGFSRGVSLPMPETEPHDREEPAPATQDAREADAKPEPEKEPEAVGRLYGKPSDGKARRTKAEMAEDEEIEKLAGDRAIPDDLPAATVLARLKEVAARVADDTAHGEMMKAAKANISTGEERIDPTSDEDKAQDAADEKAEVDANEGDSLTLDNLRQAAGVFQKKHGMATAMEVIPTILGCGLHEVPDDQIADAIAKLEAYEAPAETPKDEPFTASKEDVIEAMLQYADKYDGQRTDMAAMPVMTEDRAKVFKAALGDAVDGLSKVPDDPEAYGKAVLAFREAVEKNPFNREAKK